MKFTVVKTTSQPDVGIGSDPETTADSSQTAAYGIGLQAVVEPSTDDAIDGDDDDKVSHLRSKEYNFNSSSSSSLNDVRVTVEPLVGPATQKQGQVQGRGWPQTEQSLSIINEVGASHVDSLPPPTTNVLYRSPTTVTSGSSLRHQESTFPTVNYAPVAQRGRQYALRQTQRLVQKGGECNVISVNVTKRGQKYLADGFTTLVELRWRYQILIFVTQFIISWNAFAVVYYVTCILHGDINYSINNNNENNTWTPCITNVYDYTSALLFSLETQATIGYGVRVINPTCQFGVFMIMLQTCFGTFIQALATGLIFAKISRPKGRARTFLFSRCAVICQRDGQYQLLFRVGDMRIKSHIIGTSLRALMVRSRQTKEGEVIPICQYPLALDTETSPLNDNFVFMVWPVTAVHRIDESSPMWDMSADQFLTEQFEIVVILEGTVESTGSATQFRTSYLPSEIHWGERLAPLVTFQKQNGCYLIDYGQFHNTLPVSMPDCSAHNWALQRELEAADGASINYNNKQKADDEDYPVEFTVKTIKDPAAKSNAAARRIRKISTSKFSSALKTRVRRTTVINAPSTIATSPDKFGVWTVADPMRPDGNMSRRESLPHLDLAVGGKKFPVVVNRESNNNNNNDNIDSNSNNKKRFVSSVTPPRKRRTGSTTVAAAIASNRVFTGATSSNPPWEPMHTADKTVIRLERGYNPTDYFSARHEGRFEITENLSQV